MPQTYHHALYVLMVALLFSLPRTGVAQDVGSVVFEYGFEEGVDTTGAPIGGKLVDLTSGQTAEFILSEDIVRSGNYAFSVRSKADSLQLSARVDLALPALEYGAFYELKLWIRTDLENGGAQPRSSWNNAILLGPVGGELDWTEFSAEFQFLGGPGAELWLHVTGVGQVWYDDITITKVGEPQTDIRNGGFEEPNADATGPAFWDGQPNLGTGNPDRYVWDDTEAHSGTYSAMIQATEADHTAGRIDAAWRTSFPFQNSMWYEFSAWVKAEDLGTTSFYFNLVHNNQAFARITEDTDGWVHVVDTLQFGADVALNNPNRPLVRYRLGGNLAAGTNPKVWIDDVHIKAISLAPMLSDAVEATWNADGSVTVSWEPTLNAEQPLYHVLMQPTSKENNIVVNPSFEIPNEAGDGPEGWRVRELGPSASNHQQLDDAMAEWPSEEVPPGGGTFSVHLRSEDLDSDKGSVVYFGQNVATSASMAYWFSTMAKTEDLFVPFGKTFHPSWGDSLWTGGATIQMWTGNRSPNSDPWIASFGINTLVGTNDWTEIGIPVTHVQTTFYNNFVAVGIGQFANWGASGKAWFDEVAVVPFDKVGTTTATSYTINDVPEGVDFFAVYVENDIDGPDVESRFNVSAALAVKAASGVSVEDQTLPERISLGQNYPNPFNPSTTLEYTLPQSGTVRLVVFDVLGRRIATLVDDSVLQAGTHRVTFDASLFPSGVYLYRLEVGDQTITKKMLLVK